ncbi:hypothetical protein Cni_G18792 [Canna indica]|uniref:Uncharacterized protein n=1 Tax=Canna indica TaxID=4628 RepID=A0AAQ3KJH9_9LILI|nr:hypothetical protein Cni_G18792 [Canna indica]
MGIQEDESEGPLADSQEDILSVYHSCPGSPAKIDSYLEDHFISGATNGPWFELCSRDPDGARERRDRFMRWMGIDLMTSSRPSSNLNQHIQDDDEIQPDERIMSDSGSVLRSSDMDNNYLISRWYRKDESTSCKEALDEILVSEIKNMNDGLVSGGDNLVRDDSFRNLSGVRSISMVTSDDSRSSSSSSFIRHLMTREDTASSKLDNSQRRKGIGWLRRLGAVACIMNRQFEESSLYTSDPNRNGVVTPSRVEVKKFRKQSKDLSAVYKGQDIKAHDGEIWTMKFSPDGQYLASGGADGIVRVWHVMESERSEISIPDDDPSCIYFSVDHDAELTLLHVDKLKRSKSSGNRKFTDCTCIVIPPNVFQLSEKPIHEFHGHDADILDLSWSSDMHLLSSSKDKTVRLWRVGSDSCLRVFSHTNYVTCIQYNPINEKYFVSGSIDGKVRTWDILKCQVVDWVDIREIITAICYRPNGKGVVVGTLTGNCRFYDASDNLLQMEAQVSFHGKKKPPSRAITGFQFCPKDPQELMVTCSDSHIRLFYGIEMVAKYKGLHNPKSLISASYTEDGQHIISASGDNNVYVWNHVSHDAPMSNHVKSISSCERFLSSNASIAIPWHGLKSKNQISVTAEDLHSEEVRNDQAGFTKDDSCHLKDLYDNNTLYFSPSGSFTLGHEFSRILPKGSATWPEEKLPSNSVPSDLYKFHYKLLKKSCQNISHAWGQVILTAGWDGWIRCYQNFGLPIHL